ncbi:hypothetical protein MtrunA17_Chr4g0067551 [Medicago truncatula]|uniref:Uncharacterized protein n=1 Tax=Medicago truncatula TaxID=3880 RepID=A0A396IFI5_MEDTR|nr:hypothetical protein MtrunA17_Chr4g0067551 [Medicago truncatula]
MLLLHRPVLVRERERYILYVKEREMRCKIRHQSRHKRRRWAACSLPSTVSVLCFGGEIRGLYGRERWWWW